MEGAATPGRPLGPPRSLEPDDRVDDFQRYMAGFAMTQFRVNEGRLKFLYGLCSVALVCLGVDFAGWIWALVEQ